MYGFTKGHYVLLLPVGIIMLNSFQLGNSRRYRRTCSSVCSKPRTKPSVPGEVSTICPIFNCLLGMFGSVTKTTRLFTFPSLSRHFFLVLILVRCSFIQRFQTWQINTSMRLHHLHGLNDVVFTFLGATSPPMCPIRKWLAANRGLPLGSLLNRVSGLVFIKLSTPAKIVCNYSLSHLCFLGPRLQPVYWSDHSFKYSFKMRSFRWVPVPLNAFVTCHPFELFFVKLLH